MVEYAEVISMYYFLMNLKMNIIDDGSWELWFAGQKKRSFKD